MYTLVFSKKANKDKSLLKSAKLDAKARTLLHIISEDPFQNPPPYEMLTGNLKGYISRRISFQHRLVYQVIESEKTIHILRMWSHYEL